MRFDGSSFLTVKLHMRHEWSYVRTEFVILEGEKSLYSGKLSIKFLRAVTLRTTVNVGSFMP